MSSRTIPFAEESELSILTVRHCESPLPPEEWTAFLSAGQPLVLPPGSKHRLEVEYPAHSTAFLRITARRPALPGAMVRIVYSESYEMVPRAQPGVRSNIPRGKGDRTSRDGKGLDGPSDVYRFSGTQESTSAGDMESYEPFWWKSFRFLLLEFEVVEAPLQLVAFETKQTNYPLPLKASVNAAEPEVKTFFDISVRTLRNCIWDGYSDCPHYEQLQ
jgi:hypothetical protein